MKALLPQGTPVEHKTGTLNGLTDDVGYITLPDGRRIAVAMFARGGTNRPRTIAEAARAIYDGFTRVLTWPTSAGVLTAATRCCSTSSHAEKSADRPKPNWSSAI